MHVYYTNMYATKSVTISIVVKYPTKLVLTNTSVIWNVVILRKPSNLVILHTVE